MAEYFHLGDPNLAVVSGSTSVQMLNTGGTIIVGSSGVIISMPNRFYEIFNTGKTSSNAASTSDLIVCPGVTTVSQASVATPPTSNTSAGTTLGSQKEIPSGGGLLVCPNPVTTATNTDTGINYFPALFLIPRANDLRVRISIGPQNW